jgi:hypothetical protein
MQCKFDGARPLRSEIEKNRAFKTSVSLLLILLSSVFNELIISCARFVHLAQGPHFKYSKWSVSGQSHSRGFKHLDIASALPCLDPGLYSTVKSNAERISTNLAILPLGSLKLNSQISAW